MLQTSLMDSGTSVELGESPRAGDAAFLPEDPARDIALGLLHNRSRSHDRPVLKKAAGSGPASVLYNGLQRVRRVAEIVRQEHLRLERCSLRTRFVSNGAADMMTHGLHWPFF